MNSLAYHLFDHLVLATFTAAAPADAEWDEYAQALLRDSRGLGGLDKLRIIAVSDGGGPTALQRKRVDELSRGAPPRSAVITRSRVARGIVTAFAWFNFPIRAFAPERWRDAFEYAEVVPGQVAVIKRELQRLSGVNGARLAGEVAGLVAE